MSSERYFRQISLSLRTAAVILVLAGVMAVHVQALSAPDEAQTLELGRSFDREMAGTQEHFYTLILEAGHYARVEIRQKGTDVKAELLGADGRPILDADAEMRTDRNENVEFVAPEAGKYRLVVKGKYPKWTDGSYQIKLAEVRAAEDRDRVLNEVRMLQSEAWRLRIADRFTEAFPVAEKALQLQEQVLGPDHADLAYTLFILAVISEFRVDYPRSEAFYERARSVAERSLGPADPLLGRILSSSAYHYFRRRGDYGRAESLYQSGLSIRERSLGPDHPEVAKSVKDLGFLTLELGDYLRAENFLQRALAINIKTFGEEHVETALTLTYLGGVFMQKGDHSKAEVLFKRALDFWNRKFGEESGWAAIGLKNLAVLYMAAEEYDRAEPLFLKALFIDGKGNPPDHPEILTVRHNLAQLYYKKGQLAKVDEVSDGLLAALEKKLGPRHRVVGLHLQVLAQVRIARGDLKNAEALSRSALSILEAAGGPNYPLLAEVLLDLASIAVVQGNLKEAVSLQARAGSIIEYNLAINLAVGSERQKLAYLTTLPEHLGRAITLHTRFSGDDAAARELAAASILQRKGRVQDALAQSIESLRSRMGEEERRILDQLNAVTSRLARMVFDGPGRGSLADHQRTVRELEAQREKLESEISRRSESAYLPWRTVGLDDVQRAIPPGSALVEFAVYRPIDPKSTAGHTPEEPRYVVYVLDHQGKIGWKDLGPAKAIDDIAGRFREAVRDPLRKDAGRLARTLDETVMRPVRSIAPDAGRLLISPDGELNLVPFEALVDERGRHLIETHSVTYLATGRDLVRMTIRRESRSETAVVADPVFGELVASDRISAPPSVKEALISKRRSITTGRDLSETYFAPLSGAAEEARAIKALFPEARLLTGASATETAVKRLVAPKVLHVATHGFFLSDGNRGTSPVGPSRSPLGSASIDNPLLRSGLAFAGANTRSGERDDGILTALEAAGLNLWGTKLVVLSACDTGIGEIRNGEGVFGLRRSFALAGAESLVMSLWPVSDRVTRELMTKYYRNLKGGAGRGDALRHVQLEMLKSPMRRHPFYWASFIQSGDWTGIDKGR